MISFVKGSSLGSLYVSYVLYGLGHRSQLTSINISDYL